MRQHRQASIRKQAEREKRRRPRADTTQAHAAPVFLRPVPGSTAGLIAHTATQRPPNPISHTAPRPRLADRASAFLQRRRPRRSSPVSGPPHGNSWRERFRERCSRAVTNGSAVGAGGAARPLRIATGVDGKLDKVCFREPCWRFRLERLFFHGAAHGEPGADGTRRQKEGRR